MQPTENRLIYIKTEQFFHRADWVTPIFCQNKKIYDWTQPNFSYLKFLREQFKYQQNVILNCNFIAFFLSLQQNFVSQNARRRNFLFDFFRELADFFHFFLLLFNREQTVTKRKIKPKLSMKIWQKKCKRTHNDSANTPQGDHEYYNFYKLTKKKVWLNARTRLEYGLMQGPVLRRRSNT